MFIDSVHVQRKGFRIQRYFFALQYCFVIEVTFLELRSRGIREETEFVSQNTESSTLKHSRQKQWPVVCVQTDKESYFSG